MRQPHAADATLRTGWRVPSVKPSRARPPVWLPTDLGLRARLAVLAVLVLCACLVAAAAWEEFSPPRAPAPAAPTAGTAFLQTTTCANWQAASAERRMVIVRTLAVAATRPDPENPGATLSNGAAYGLFQRVCSTPESRSTLLYESYNRAASFGSLGAGSVAISGGFGQH
jgi:hypothetical protein